MESQNANTFNMNIDNIISNLKEGEYQAPNKTMNIDDNIKMSEGDKVDYNADYKLAMQIKNEEECLRFKELEQQCLRRAKENKNNFQNKSIYQVKHNIESIRINSAPKNLFINKYCNSRKEYKDNLNNKMQIDEHL